jgi:hypothetical protein
LVDNNNKQESLIETMDSATEFNIEHETSLCEHNKHSDSNYHDDLDESEWAGSGIVFKFVKDINYINKYKGFIIKLINNKISDYNNHCVYEINISKVNDYDNWCDVITQINYINLKINDLNFSNSITSAFIIVVEVDDLINDLIVKTSSKFLTKAFYKCNFSIFYEHLWVKSEYPLIKESAIENALAINPYIRQINKKIINISSLREKSILFKHLELEIERIKTLISDFAYILQYAKICKDLIKPVIREIIDIYKYINAIGSDYYKTTSQTLMHIYMFTGQDATIINKQISVINEHSCFYVNCNNVNIIIRQIN